MSQTMSSGRQPPLSILDQELMHTAFTMPPVPQPAAVPKPFAPNGRTMPERKRWLPEIGVRRKRQRWALPSLAAALLILLAGIGSCFAFYNDATQQPAVIPAVTVESTPSSDVEIANGSPAAGLDATAIELVWDTSSNESPLLAPVGIALAPAGNLYVVDSVNNQIQIFGPNGQFLESWGREGTGPGEFQFGTDDGWNGTLDFDADGNIYVFDFMNNRIQKFDPERNFLLEWGALGSENGQFIRPLGAVDDARGFVYVADLLNNRVQVFDLEGNFLDMWGSTGTANGKFRQPVSVAVGPDGTIYVGDKNNRIQAFDQHGAFLYAFGGLGGEAGQIGTPYGLAIDASGNVFVADYSSRILIFRPDGNFVGIIDEIEDTAPLDLPNSVRLDKEGYLYVADEWKARVLKLKLPPIE